MPIACRVVSTFCSRAVAGEGRLATMDLANKVAAIAKRTLPVSGVFDEVRPGCPVALGRLQAADRAAREAHGTQVSRLRAVGQPEAVHLHSGGASGPRWHCRCRSGQQRLPVLTQPSFFCLLPRSSSVPSASPSPRARRIRLCTSWWS